MHVRLRIGCAGWSIAARQAAAFPRAGSHLERYASTFDAVEINSSFHRPHRPRTYAKWADAVPEGFRFAVKLPKSISHERRLRDCEGELQTFLAAVRELRGKLGVLLLQLPPSLAFDGSAAPGFFDALRERYEGPFACEPRHASWFDAAVDATLRARRIARVAADPARTPRAAVPGGDHAVEYFRLHGSPRVYYDAYPDEALRRIARRLARPSTHTRERWCIFDNTALGHATFDALTLRASVVDA
ncbi:DUF72 domain-containing protein [Dokdonella sp.]|uniref:DUF72 domain-containing protein n=1 Tax=Dokdonella sp. TaxID=2291710 RepID=UPI002F420039